MHTPRQSFQLAEGRQRMIVGPEALQLRRERTAAAQRRIAKSRESWIQRWAYYRKLMSKALAFFVEPGERVLNLRCQTGWMLKAVRPSQGVGLEITEEMVQEARKLYPEFRYEVGYPDLYQVRGEFDSILVADPGETADLQEEFRLVHNCCNQETRVYVYAHNSLWESAFWLAERLGIKMPQPEPSWLTEFDLRGLLELAGFEIVKVHHVGLFPFGVPLLSYILNHWVAALPGVRSLCLFHLIVARPIFKLPKAVQPSVSVIIPCRNEEGNIRPAVARMPELGGAIEIIFCDDMSTDRTRLEVEEVIRDFPEKNIHLVLGPGICKSKNVWAGFDAAKGEILVILDADLTVMPEELPRFIEAIAENRGEFINGSRLVYPIPREAMKLTNRIGNVVFSYLFSLLLGQRIKDTLCGTKVLWRRDWLRMKKYVSFWGISDRWGDYDLLLGAAKLNLKIRDMPIHYQERVAGVSKMTRVLYNAGIMLKIMWKASVKMRRYDYNLLQSLGGSQAVSPKSGISRV